MAKKKLQNSKKLDDYKEGRKSLKLYFCPKCDSRNVGYVFRFGNAFGVIPRMECKKCSYSSMIFPQVVLNKAQLDKANKKVKK